MAGAFTGEPRRAGTCPTSSGGVRPLPVAKATLATRPKYEKPNYLRRVITCVLDLDEWDNDAVLEQVRTITISPHRQAVVALENGKVHTITLGEEN